MMKFLLILGLVLLATASTALAVDVCFTMTDETFNHLKDAFAHNYRWSPSMNLTTGQFAKQIIIKQWRREITRYDLWLASTQLPTIPIT